MSLKRTAKGQPPLKCRSEALLSGPERLRPTSSERCSRSIVFHVEARDCRGRWGPDGSFPCGRPFLCRIGRRVSRRIWLEDIGWTGGQIRLTKEYTDQGAYGDVVPNRRANGEGQRLKSTRGESKLPSRPPAARATLPL